MGFLGNPFFILIMSATLFVIATPIGNLEDITLRALRILKEVDVVVCEDTRVTGKLLAHFEIKKPMLSYNAHATEGKHEKILDILREGKDIALVSDAGTPTISDPGSMLVDTVRHELPDVTVVSVPGASALAAALSVSGVPSSEFLFLGFLPHKKGRETLFAEIAKSERPVVFYESSHRILKALASLAEKLPADRMVVVCRELTKLFEETVRGTAPEVLAYYIKNTDKVRGEFVVIVR